MGKQVGGPTKEQKAMMKQMREGPMNPMEDFMIPPDQMINLPPKPPNDYKIFWPIHETFSMDPSMFFVIYPSYMDSSKTGKQGRRIGKEKSVDTPTVGDISEALQSLRLRHVVEPHKGYSRDPTALWDNPGRVKIEPTGGEYTKRSLLVELASIIVELPSRIKRLDVIAAVEKAKEAKRRAAKEEKEKQQQLAIKSSIKSNSNNKSSNKKKGKKKR